MLGIAIGRPSADIGLAALRYLGIYEGEAGQVLVNPGGILAQMTGLRQTAQQLHAENEQLKTLGGGVLAANRRLEGELASLRSNLQSQAVELDQERAEKLKLLVVMEQGTSQLRSEKASDVETLRVQLDQVCALASSTTPIPPRLPGPRSLPPPDNPDALVCS